MKSTLLLKNLSYFTLIFLYLAISSGCQKSETGPANLSVVSIEFEETHHVEFIDLPDGTYQPDNPNFSMNTPSTWTGNMAQYVVNRYFYSVSYVVHNSGGGTAYDAEIDLGLFFTNGNDEFETKSMGNISGGQNASSSFQIIRDNKQLEECAGEVYWYEY